MAEQVLLDRLSSEQFEELCYDLMKELGATRVAWRKGTGLSGSPADQGRDIECEFPYELRGAGVLTERRFVECKHYARGVPPEKLQGALTWALAERPDTLHFIISGFLSNSAKQALESFKAQNRPSFRILVWERPELLSHLEFHARLRRKYELSDVAPHLALLHPVHVEYLGEAPLFTLDSFFRVLDNLEPNQRLEFLGHVKELVIAPRYREPRSVRESIAETRLDPVDYPAFRRACYGIKLDQAVLVTGILDFTLHGMVRIADFSRTGQMKEGLQDMIAFLEQRITGENVDRESLQRLLTLHREMLSTADDRMKRNYRRYTDFCDQVLRPLLDQREKFLTLGSSDVSG